MKVCSFKKLFLYLSFHERLSFFFLPKMPTLCCAVDLLTGGLLPSSLKRERHPCVRSLSWSDLGMSQNYGYYDASCR